MSCRITALAMIFVLLIISSSAVASSTYHGESGEDIGDMYVINCNEYVSLRKKPSTSAEAVKMVPLGATVLKCRVYNDDFISCVYDGKTGYILSEYLVKSVDDSQTFSYENGRLGKSEFALDCNQATLNNITLAAEAVNGIVLNHNDVFSFNTVVGPRTSSRGYETGTNGRGVEVMGGGVAQVATIIWQTIKYMDNIKILVKHNYGKTFTEHYVFDLDDTIVTDYANKIDLSFRYTGDYPVAISCNIYKSYIICSLDYVSSLTYTGNLKALSSDSDVAEEYAAAISIEDSNTTYDHSTNEQANISSFSTIPEIQYNTYNYSTMANSLTWLLYTLIVAGAIAGLIVAMANPVPEGVIVAFGVIVGILAGYIAYMILIGVICVLLNWVVPFVVNSTVKIGIVAIALATIFGSGAAIRNYAISIKQNWDINT